MKEKLLIVSFAVLGMQPVYAQSNIAVLITAPAPVIASNTSGRIAILSQGVTQTTPVSTIYIDSTGSNAMRFSGSATSTGYLATSEYGFLVSFAGVATSVTSGNTNTVLSRGVGTVDGYGTYTMAATYTGATGNQPRCATRVGVSDTSWYIADQGGLYTRNATTPSPTTNFRAVKSYAGITYASAASSSVTQVSTVSSAVGGTVTGLPGLTTNSNLVDFCMMSSVFGQNGFIYDLLYVLSLSGTTGTITKYSLVNGTWVSNGSYTTPSGGFSIAARDNVPYDGARLFVTTGTGATTGNSVIQLTDSNGYNAPLNINTANNLTLYTAPAGHIIKGVALAPMIAIPLNVNLKDITAKNTSAGNIITWSTAQENGGEHMQLTRSTDARNFVPIATINSKGANSSYSYTDAQPAEGVNYYRLLITDAAGNSTGSKVVSATAKPAGISVTGITPNPVQGQRIRISFSNQLYGNCRIAVTNELGQIVYSHTQNTDNQNTIGINLPASLRQGIYYLTLDNDKNHFSQRIVVE